MVSSMAPWVITASARPVRLGRLASFGQSSQQRIGEGCAAGILEGKGVSEG